MIPKITSLTDTQVLMNREESKSGISTTGEMNGRRVMSIDPAMAQKGGKIKVGHQDGFLYTLFKVCFYVILSPILLPIWFLSALLNAGSNHHHSFYAPNFRSHRRVHVPAAPPVYGAPHPHVGRGLMGGGRVGIPNSTLRTNRVRVF